MKPHAFNPFLSAATAALFLALATTPASQAADRTKLNNTNNLNLGTSWTGGNLPDLKNMAVWTNTVTGANSSVLGGDVYWQGIRIANPGGPVTIGAGNTLTLGAGQAGTSIDMSSATANLTIQSGLTAKSALGQLWNIGSGRTLTLNTGTFTRGAGATLNVQGAGSVVTTMTNFSTASLVNGLIGPWATIGTGTSASFATINGSNTIVAATGTAAATAANVTDTTGAVNYDVAAVGALGAGASFNTLRYTGAAGTISGNFTANGILTAGTGALIMSGNVTIGANRELVLTNGDNNALRNLTLSGIIGDSPTGPSGVTKAGTGNVYLSGANTYSGITTISRGKLVLESTGSLGSTAAGTRIGLSGTLTLNGGVTTAEPLFIDDITNAFNGANVIENIGTNTLTGAVRLGADTRWQSGGTLLNVTGGISTTNGAAAGSRMIMQAADTMNITGKPISGGTGILWMDVANKTIALGVAGSTYGSHNLYGGTMRTDLPNVLPSSAVISFGVDYAGGAATLDLNGNSQTVGGISSNIFLATSGFDRVITSATAATLTVNNGAGNTFDGRLTGAVALTKTGAGTLTLTGPSTTTGGLTVNGGTVNLNFAKATASASGASSVSNYLPSAAPLTLGGGTFQLTGRNNGTATSLTNATWASGASTITVGSTTNLAPGQLITGGSGLPAGAYVVSILSGTQFVINANTSAAQAAATTISATANSFTTAQTFNGLTLNPGASAVSVTIPSSGSSGTVLNLGAITANPGATVNFTLPTGTQNATNGITTSTTNNAGGILGGWARVGNDWAINSTNAAGGNIVALATYTGVNRLGGSITSSSSTNVRINNGGASGEITPGAIGTTDIHTLLQNADAGTATYNPGTTDVLRLGASGGVMVASTAGALTIGASANDGILTAGGAANTAGTLYLTNNSASNLLAVNSTVADNGTGVVSLTTSGAGTTVLAGTNTYTGRTIAGGGTLRVSSEQNLGTNPAAFAADQLTLAGVLNATASFNIDDANRGLTIAAAGGTVSVNSTFTLGVANPIAGTGNLTVSGAGTLALNAANSFTGDTFANAGTLALGHVQALQNSTLTTATAGDVTFTAAGTNTYQLGGLAGNDTVTLGANSLSVGANHATTVFSGSLTGTGGLIKTGDGTLNLTAANSHTGDTRIEGGMIVLAHANALQNSTLDTGPAGTQSANLTLPEATVYSLGGLKGSANLDLAVSHLSVGSNNQSTTFSGVLQGAFNNNLTKTGAGTLTLSGNNTYSGGTTVNAGALNVTSAGSLASSSNLTIGSSATANLSNSGQTLGAVSNANTASNALNFSASSGTVTLASLSGAGNTRFGSNATITGGIGAGTVNAVGLLTANITSGTVGAGSLTAGTVSGGTNTITGAAGITTLSGGTTTVGGVATITTMSAGTANLDGATNSIGTYNGGSLALGNSTALSVSDGSSSGVISGGGSLTKTGAGTLALSGNNTYSGGTTVNAGALNVTSAGSLASSSNLTIGSSATANLSNSGQTLGAVSNANTASNALNFSASSGTVTLASLSGAGNTRFGSNATITGGIGAGTVNAVGLLTANITSGTVGAGSLTAGTVSGGTNTITGAAGITTLSGGTTTVGGVATITTMSAGTANLDGATNSIGTYNGGSLALGNSTALSVSDGSSSGVISGGGSLTKAGAGTLALLGINTYTGNTTVSAGTLAINGSVAGAVGVNSGATLQGSGSIGGALSVSGQLSPGNSIESLGASSISFLNGSSFAYELDSSVLGGDLLYTIGALSITPTTTLSLTDMAAGILANDSKLTLISYGSWSGGLFTYNGSTLANGAKFTLGSNEWLFKYDDTTGGSNFSGDQSGAVGYVTMTVVPEPNVAMVAGSLALMVLLRRRRD